MALNIKSTLHRLNRRDIPLFPKFKINKYFKIVLILFVALSTIFVTKTILAQTNTSNTESVISSEAVQGFQDKQNAMEEGNNQESWMKESLGSNAMVGINIIAGTIPSDVLNGKKNTTWVPGGLIGFTNKSIATLFDLPVSSTQYYAYVKNNLLGKPAYAESGFQGLAPILNIWKGFRNVTYILFSVIFVVIGIMIMLRIKISPQAVITVQSAIPGLITSLVLITFSYAIVGLLIDLSYVITGLGLSIINSATANIPDFYSKSIQSTSVLESISKPRVLGQLFKIANIGGSPWLLTTGIVNNIIFNTNGLEILYGWNIGIVAYIIIFLILLIFIFITIIKFCFGIAVSYVKIILKTIIAPLEIALGAIPNMKMGFNTWFIDIFANIMVFPICLIVLSLIKKIMDTMWVSTYIWTPPIIDSMSYNGKFIATLFGLGGLLLISKLPKLIPEFIFQLKPSPFGKAIGEATQKIPGVGLTRSLGGAITSNIGYNAGKAAFERFSSNVNSKDSNKNEAGEGNPNVKIPPKSVKENPDKKEY